VLLLCLTSILQPVRIGWPYQEYKTPASVATRVTEVRNPPTRKGDSTRGAFILYIFMLIGLEHLDSHVLQKNTYSQLQYKEQYIFIVKYVFKKGDIWCFKAVNIMLCC